MKPSTPQQRQLIAINCPEKDNRETLVMSLTDGAYRSAKDLTFEQAQTAIKLLTNQDKHSGYARFDKNNPKHMLILSLCRQAQWVEPSEKYGEVVDLERLSNWLQSRKSPVQKPIKKMTASELEKVIKALTGIVKYTFKEG